MPVKASAGHTRSWKISAPPACGGRSMATRWRHSWTGARGSTIGRARGFRHSGIPRSCRRKAPLSICSAFTRRYGRRHGHSRNRLRRRSLTASRSGGLYVTAWRSTCSRRSRRPYCWRRTWPPCEGFPCATSRWSTAHWRLSPRPPWRTPRGAAVCGGICARARSEVWLQRHGAGGRLTPSGRCFQSAERPDACWPAGYGFDLQRLVMELRRSGVLVDQITEMPQELAVSQATVTGAINEAVSDLLRQPRLWQPVEACGVGRTQLWEMALARWWTGLVTRHWSAYASAARRFRARRYDAAIVINMGSEGIGGAVVSAAKAVGGSHVSVSAWRVGGYRQPVAACLHDES